MQKYFKHKKNSPFKLITIIAAIIAVLTASTYYINKSYNSYINKFYSSFNNCDFDTAKELFNTDNLITKLKSKSITMNLKEYFTSIVSIISSEIENGRITTENALTILKEIDTYQILSPSLEKMILTLDPSYTPTTDYSCNSFLEIAESYCNSGSYSEALDLLNKIPANNAEYYSAAQTLINKCKDCYRNELFNEADKLVADDYYTKAIDLLSNADSSILGESDAEILSKINKVEQLKDNYLASIASEATNTNTATVMSENVSINNINTSNIESITNYLIYVNEEQQLVYIYNGSCNNWDLMRNYECSTGIASEPTPTGIFKVTDRGEWFYSEQYEQGGKYWVQFLGDYLFHSLPYDEDQDEIVDNTLGVPASHGCIRLDTEDAKWIYDNIPNDTTVIIN